VTPIEEMGYPVVGEWNDLLVYEIPVKDLLGVRSAIFTRRLGAYTHFVNSMLSGSFQQVPLLCFVAGDDILRVKHGNVIYWPARETQKVEALTCVFPMGPEKTDALLPELMKEFKYKFGAFC